jgi:hypothetical protein
MRERFELHSKTVGLVVFCIGAYNSLSSGVLFLQGEPDVTKMMPSSTLKLLPRSDVAALQTSTSYVRKYALKALLLSGIAPLLLGFYLMRSNNLFVRLCYPAISGNPPSAPSGPDGPVKRNVSAKVAGSPDDRKPDSRYAPPGYSDQ